MKSIILVFSLILISILSSFAQNKRDYVWLLGWGDHGDHDPQIPGVNMYTFDFNNSPFEVSKTDNYYAMQANASICDPNGNLLFYSNGCAVLNADRQVMVNGDSINYGSYFEWFNGSNCFHGYNMRQDIIILTDPAYENGYYLIHKKKRKPETGSIYINQMFYTYIDMSKNNDKGEVIEKNMIFYEDEILMSNYLTSIQHENGKDWWIIQPMKDTNVYLTYLLDDEGFHQQEDQAIGKNFHWNSSASGTAKFSPDGTMYTLYNEEDGVLLFDFDRNSGELSNYRRTVPDATTGSSIFCSIEWSPNSQYVYTASKNELFQIDILNDDLEDGTILIGEYDGTKIPFSNTFFLMAQGPDCRIYMCSTSGNKAYHVINYPDEKGLDCGFVQNGIDLPYNAGFASMPNHPRWRVDEEEKCDPSIVSVFGIPVYTMKDLEIYPNPTRDMVKVKIPNNQSGIIEVRNSKGMLVETINVNHQTIEQQLNLGHYSTGLYYIEFVPENNKKKLIWTGKVVLLDK